jgi:hypothetical protein
MTAHPDRPVDQALAYAQGGWPVFPCQPGGKEPATRHGFHDASTDPNLIRLWWTRLPEANVAVATGQPGPDVLDVDQHGQAGNGFAAFNRLKHAGLLEGCGTIVATPGGGLHAYFAGSDQTSGRLPRQHLDFRSSGGYVVVPPSVVRGRQYRLVRYRRLTVGLDWSAVTRLLEPERDRPALPLGAAQADVGRLAGWVERLEEGNRNSGLFWAACRAVEAGQPGLLDHLAAAAARAGLPDREIARTIASASRSAQPTAGRQAECEGA